MRQHTCNSCNVNIRLNCLRKVEMIYHIQSYPGGKLATMWKIAIRILSSFFVLFFANRWHLCCNLRQPLLKTRQLAKKMSPTLIIQLTLKVMWPITRKNDVVFSVIVLSLNETERRGFLNIFQQFPPPPGKESVTFYSRNCTVSSNEWRVKKGVS